MRPPCGLGRRVERPAPRPGARPGRRAPGRAGGGLGRMRPSWELGRSAVELDAATARPGGAYAPGALDPQSDGTPTGAGRRLVELQAGAWSSSRAPGRAPGSAPKITLDTRPRLGGGCSELEKCS